MTHKVLWGASEDVAKWVSAQVGHPNFGLCIAAGVMIDGRSAAGAVFHNFIRNPVTNEPISMEVSCAAVDKRWASRQVLKELLTYPFITVGVKRLQVSIPVASKGVISFNKKLGFTWEGTGRCAHFLGGDLYVMSMLKDECKWIKDNSNVEISTFTARRPDSSGNERRQ